MKTLLSLLGSTGSVISAMAAAAPCCLPLLAGASGAIGLNTLLPYSSYTLYAVQAFALLALMGAFVSYKKHRYVGPVLLSVGSALAIFFAYNVSLIAYVLYLGLAGLVVAAIWNLFLMKRCNQCPTAT